MAEGLKFWEKTPGNWRLDHPDFRDVHESTFAKGVIKEFQILQENPIQVASMVKVEVNGELHDEFIPLFYLPKEGYWDGEDVKARDFDAERGCFKQAWQSFRAGDEVAVLLKQATPLAVVGFHDNVPRLGEDVCRLEYQDDGGAEHFFHIRFSATNQEGHRVYAGRDEEAQGPDGKPLHLVRECLRVALDEYESKTWERVSSCSTGHFVGGDQCECFWGWQWYVRFKATHRVADYLVRIGPVLYLLHFYTVETGGPQELWEFYFEGCGQYEAYGQCTNDDPGDQGAGTLLGLYPPESEVARPVLAFDLTAPPEEKCERLQEVDWTFYLPHWLNDRTSFFKSFIAKAAPFTPEFYEQAKGGPSGKTDPVDKDPWTDAWTNIYEGFNYQSDFDPDFYVSAEFTHPKLPSLKLYERPHAREELVEAGLWPEGEEQ